MFDEHKIPPELAELERRLGAINVPPAKIDRDELLFQSGWAAAMAEVENQQAPAARLSENRNWIWPAMTGAMATVAAVLAVILFLEPATNQPNSVVTNSAVESEPGQTDLKPAPEDTEPPSPSTGGSFGSAASSAEPSQQRKNYALSLLGLTSDLESLSLQKQRIQNASLAISFRGAEREDAEDTSFEELQSSNSAKTVGSLLNEFTSGNTTF